MQNFLKINSMAKIRGAIVVDNVACKGCAVCAEACPTNTIGLAKEVNAKGYNYAYAKTEDTCIGCASCAMVCPDSCITVYKMKVA